MKLSLFALRCMVVLGLVLVAGPARAVPAFARKYGTSCLTCHTVFPKLTPFGEAFRRNNYRFPGVDSDYVKQDTIALGQEANKKSFPNAVWPATLPGSVPVAVGFIGSANVYPDKSATIPRTNNKTTASFDGLAGEGQVFVGGGLSDTVTVFAELSIADGGADVEHAQVFFSDVTLAAHAVNVAVGKGPPTLTSFGPHSSYAGGLAVPDAPVTGIYALSEAPFVLGGNYNGVELNGVVGGRVNYALGWNAGANAFGGTFNSEDTYFTLGYKWGGMRLDGEGATGPADPMRPWAETALTLHGFVYHATERFPDPTTTESPAHNTSFTVGGGLRAQHGSTELDLGYYHQQHDHGTATLGKVTSDMAYGELSHVVYPWLVPFLRAQRIGLHPDGGAAASDLAVLPGVAFLVRPNVKVVVLGSIEQARGFPSDAGGGPLPWQGGGGDTGSFVIGPAPGATASTHAQEFSSITFLLAWAI